MFWKTRKMEQELNIVKSVSEKCYKKYNLMCKDKVVGKLIVWPDRDENYDVIESYIDEKYRGMGYGKKLYEYAIKDIGHLTTIIKDSSEDAKRVWKSLCKKYKYSENKFHGTLTVFSKMAV